MSLYSIITQVILSAVRTSDLMQIKMLFINTSSSSHKLFKEKRKISNEILYAAKESTGQQTSG
jgi:hypothetical protein